MATTAQLSVDETSLAANAPAHFTLVLSNGGGDAVTVESFGVTTTLGASAAVDVPSFDTGDSTEIAGSNGTLALTFEGVFFATKQRDGAPTEATAVSVQVDAHLSDGTTASSNTVSVSVVPTFEPAISTSNRAFGQLRFDSNNQTANLFALL